MNWPLLLSTLLLSSKSVLLAGTKPSSQAQEPPIRVVFVHGIFDSGHDFHRFAKFTSERQWISHCPSLKRGDGRATMSELAEQLDAYITANLPPKSRFHLVGHSMGGIICKQFIMEKTNAGRVSSLTTIGSPHDGSGWAQFLPLPGARDLRPGSPLLTQQKEHHWEIPILNIYSPLDLVVFNWRSKWEGHPNHRTFVPAHSLLIRTRGNFEKVAGHIDDCL